MELNNNSGAIRISDEVLADIAIKAALEVDGIVGVRQRLIRGARSLVNGKSTTVSGIMLTNLESGLVVTLQVAVRFGIKIQDVSAKVQQAVAEAVADMTGMTVRSVNVVVVNVVATRRADCKKISR
jgi:uncharacterized alkaline shock family protein YloU